MLYEVITTAVTVCYNPQYDVLVQAAEESLNKAMSMVKIGVKASDVGRIIETTIKQMGLKPIANLSGHSLEQYTIHAGKTIPNIWSIGGFTLSGDSAYACEPFVTTSEGGGFVRNGKIRNIFALNSRKNVITSYSIHYTKLYEATVKQTIRTIPGSATGYSMSCTIIV